MRHIIFFDGDCGLCQRSVRSILSIDHKGLFVFAPLEGKTAYEMLSGKLEYLRHENSLVLLESPEQKIWTRGRAVFRIFWLLGGKWRLLGWLYVAPFVDFFYKLVASRRHHFGKPITFDVKDRFLP